MKPDQKESRNKQEEALIEVVHNLYAEIHPHQVV